MINYLQYWLKITIYICSGGKKYFTWIGFLLLLISAGVFAYYQQFKYGLLLTNMTDEVSWGVYIANFTFLVGVAAAAVLLVVPTYVYGREDVKEVVIFGELMAVSAIIMCMLFVMVDLGHPDRFMHLIPKIGRLNFPSSILAWDIIVLNVYLFINVHVSSYLLYKKYLGEAPSSFYYKPLVFLSIGWAISIHTVTAFLYSGLGGRPYWNSAILASRFLVSAFASGPALMAIVFVIINKISHSNIKPSVIDLLRKILQFTLPLNLFLLFCEVFKEFYTNSVHTMSISYLFFGINGYGMLQPFIWTAIILSSIASLIFLSPFSKRKIVLIIASVMTVLSVWIEKGMGLIIPGFIPTPLGDLVEYTPSIIESVVSMGIWALGTLLFTLMIKAAIGIETGAISKIKK